ncbi:MAG: hypothetical protein CHACPFDD_02017 [Phycisphaerae bacterium]|nr:hypothetical protein [Phycisphaerae bacterium]
MEKAAPPATPSLDPSQAASRTLRRLRAGLAVALLALVFISGAPSLDARWIQGDEQIFIVANSDVTGAGRAEPLVTRLVGIFAKRHEDLYQPIPILSYALEWAAWGDRPERHRLIDVALHAINGLLVWSVVAGILRRSTALRAPGLDYLSFAAGLLWVLHPIQVSSYAGDMGRTHLLSALFGMLSLRAHLRHVDTGRAGPLVAALALLVAAMMCKPMVAWFALVFALEAVLRGVGAAVRSPGIYFYALCGAIFAALTLQTTRASGMMEDTTEAIFGDPLSRSLLAVWLYFRNLLLPLWLSTWYVPDERTGWAYAPVWIGGLLVAANVVLIIAALRRPRWRLAAVGLIWFWCLLLPVIGVVGARVAAANDRYVYQPLIGLLLALAAAVAPRLERRASDASGAPRRHVRTLLTATGAFSAAFVFLNMIVCANARSSVLRAQRVLELYPGNPRATECLAAALSFASNHDCAEYRAYGPQRLAQLAHAALHKAGAEAAGASTVFPTPGDRASFHRRLSYRLLGAGDAIASLAQAEAAREVEPDSTWTWTRLAHALRALDRRDEARAAYEQIEKRIKTDDPYYALRMTEFGTLMLNQFDDPATAAQKFRAALSADPTLAAAQVGLARSEIRGGLGASGLQIIQRYLGEHPGEVDALLVLAEYHLRSHHWDAAERIYSDVLREIPAQYEALRGFHEVCAQTDRWPDALAAWRRGVAATAAGTAERLRLSSFAAWAAACAGDSETKGAIDDLLRIDRDNPLGCYGMALLALRRADVNEAHVWVVRARRGVPIPWSNAGLRAAATIRLMLDRGQLLSEAVVIEAAIRAAEGLTDPARALLEAFVAEHPTSAARELADQVLSGMVQPSSAP